MNPFAPADPRATVALCLARIATEDGRIGAMVHVDRDRAVRDAEASTTRWATNAPLSTIDGMPIAIKANIAVKGWPWTAGIEAYADRIAGEDAACVARLRAAGAVLIGATNMDEGALGALTDNRWSGRTHNPHRHGFTAGGSSGGSAAAVAAGFCVAALGTDTIGSVRIPASYCGVFGYKPRREEIPMDGIVPLSPTLDTIGILSATAGICGRLSAIARGGEMAPPVRLAGISIAVPDWGSLVADPAQRAAFDKIARAAERAGARMMPLSGDVFPLRRAQRLLLTIAEVEGAIVHRDALRARPKGFSPEFAALLAWGAGEGAGRFDAVREELAALATAAHAALAGIDALLCPATPRPAFAFGTGVPADQSLFAALASCLGDAATAFPIGFSPAGLPLSAQVMAGSDALCLAVAGALADQCDSSPPDTFIDSAVM